MKYNASSSVATVSCGNTRSNPNTSCLLARLPQASPPITHACVYTPPVCRSDTIWRSPVRRWSTHTDVSTRITDQFRGGAVCLTIEAHSHPAELVDGRFRAG